MDRGAWQATVHGAAQSQTRLSDFHFHRHRKLKLMKSKPVVFRAWDRRREVTANGSKGALGDGNVLYLDCRNGFT